MIDEIAGVMNRSQFKEALARALDAEETVTLALIDIDRMTQINEQEGQAAGDRLIAFLAAALQDLARDHRWAIGRVGADEFAVAMPGTPLERGFLQIEAVRCELVQKAEATLVQMRPTLSAGVANYPRDAKDTASLMQRADHALFQAKEAGRNTISLPSRDEMVLRSCYYTTSQLARLKKLADQTQKKEAVLLREALDDLLRKYDVK